VKHHHKTLSVLHVLPVHKEDSATEETAELQPGSVTEIDSGTGPTPAQLTIDVDPH